MTFRVGQHVRVTLTGSVSSVGTDGIFVVPDRNKYHVFWVDQFYARPLRRKGKRKRHAA